MILRLVLPLILVAGLFTGLIVGGVFDGAGCPKGQHAGIVSSYWIPSIVMPGHETAFRVGNTTEEEYVPGYTVPGHFGYIWGCEQ